MLLIRFIVRLGMTFIVPGSSSNQNQPVVISILEFSKPFFKNIMWCIFLKDFVFMKISMKFVHKGVIDNIDQIGLNNGLDFRKIIV